GAVGDLLDAVAPVLVVALVVALEGQAGAGGGQHAQAGSRQEGSAVHLTVSPLPWGRLPACQPHRGGLAARPTSPNQQPKATLSPPSSAPARRWCGSTS